MIVAFSCKTDEQEADLLLHPPQFFQDIGGLLKGKVQIGLLFLYLFGRPCNRPEITHRCRLDYHCGLMAMGQHRLTHLDRRLDPHQSHIRRAGQRCRAGDQGHIRPPPPRCPGQTVAHLS